ncbi:KEOPS complex Pcc1-like subunit [Halobacteriales archaeon SW_7_68_16]|nr:MAG: KEOPS complex Pcc1-like subunit [Halobacteriales archaeon SW_7_68_16]
MTAGDHRTTLTFSYDDATTAGVVAAAVDQEVGEIDDDRSRTTIERTDATITVEIEAADVIALRAAVNTWLGLLGVGGATNETADVFTPGA